jgi:choline-sulfatase
VTRALGRIVFSWMGAAFGALLVAVSEGRSASLAAEGSHPPPLGELVLAELGVLAPLAMLLGTAVAVVSFFLEPERPVAPSERIAALRAQPVLARSRTAAMVPLACFVATAWCVATAHTARGALSHDAPMAAGVALAVASLAWLAGLSACALAVLPSVRRGLAAAASRWPRAIDPATTGVVGLTAALLVFAAGVRGGDTGGEGGTVLAVFGVLKRNELDLRPVIDVLAIGACAWLAPLALAGRAPRVVPSVIAVAAVAAPLWLTAREAHGLESDPALARVIERHAPLGRIALAAVRRATDRDHDGASPLFGGGDCDDTNPEVSPLAVEVPGNGIDEDCSGADLPLPSPPPAASSSGTASGPAVPDRDYNLIFITVDTLRAADMGFLGYDKPTTPNLDALAAESVVFDDAYALASYTGKALAPMLIGKYPSETLRDGGHFNRYFNGNEFLAERLRAAGVTTMGAASHWYFRDTWGVTQGFDAFDLSAMPPSGQGDTDTTTTSPQLTDAAIKLLQKNAGSKRFFLWVHYFDPHAEYVTHPGAPDFGDPAKPPGWYLHAAYDNEVWFTDLHIGRLLDYARAQSWWKDTVVALTSDHGEAMREHGMSYHGFEIWQPLVRVPLLVRAPGVAPHHVPVKRSTIDVVPTLLELMRVPAPAPGELSGRSLAPDLAAKDGHFEERDVYVDMPDGPNTHMRRALVRGTTPGMKLIHFGGRQYQLFDLANDPGEREDLSSDGSKLQPMIEAMQALRAGLREINVKPDAPAQP